MTATRFLIRSPPSTRREEPHAEQTSSRGRVSALMRPIWPHGHVTRISMELHPKNSPGRTGAESHCTTKLVQAPHYLAYTVCADGARRPRGAEVAPSFEHCSAHEDADADEQEQHEDEDNDLDHDEEKAPGDAEG